MAKIHLDRLQKKYGDIVSGKNYSSIVQEILFQNSENVNNKLVKINSDKWRTLSRKVMPKEKRLVMPDIEEVVPKRALTILKTGEHGFMIRETLRDSLTLNLRNSLDKFDTGGKGSYIRQRGATAGRINPELIKDFEKNIYDTFTSYTKKNPSIGMPPSVHEIAVTEVRSAVNNIKKDYANQLLENNPDIKAEKVWIHNPKLSKKKPRTGHRLMHNKRVPMNGVFKVPIIETVKGKVVGYDSMLHPHSPGAPAYQVIGCNCDYDIIVSRRKKNA